MALRIKKFQNIAEANFVLQGGLIVGQLPATRAGRGNVGYLGLIGESLTFTSPADDHTFTQPAGGTAGILTFQDVVTQLEAGVVGLLVEKVGDRMGFRHSTPGTLITLAAADEPARAILGLANPPTSGAAHASQFVNADGLTDPFFVGMSADQSAIIVIINE